LRDSGFLTVLLMKIPAFQDTIPWRLLARRYSMFQKPWIC